MANLFTRATVTVSSSAIVVLAANPKRKWAIIQQTSANPVRVGDSLVTATTGISLAQRDKIILEGKDCPTDAIYAIREGGSDGTVSVIEEVDV